MEADIGASLALTASLRKVMSDLIAAKKAGSTGNAQETLSSEGARLLMEMRRLETDMDTLQCSTYTRPPVGRK